jgi:hypothetical protein
MPDQKVEKWVILDAGGVIVASFNEKPLNAQDIKPPRRLVHLVEADDKPDVLHPPGFNPARPGDVDTDLVLHSDPPLYTTEGWEGMTNSGRFGGPYKPEIQRIKRPMSAETQMLLDALSRSTSRSEAASKLINSDYETLEKRIYADMLARGEDPHQLINVVHDSIEIEIRPGTGLDRIQKLMDRIGPKGIPDVD